MYGMAGLRWGAAICALVGLAALIAHVALLLPMPYFLTFVGVPSVLLIFIMAAYAKWVAATVLVNCLVVGFLGGLTATLFYDGVRFLFRLSDVFDYDGFTAIYIFGSWITGTEPNTLVSAVAGWTYHFWNGISFGIFYSLTFGRRHWLFGVGYGIVMELCMLGLFPFFLRVTNKLDFIAVSLIGHMVYGFVLGLVAHKYGRNWKNAD